MEQKNKLLEIGKHSIIYMIGSFIQGIIALILLPYITREFSVSQYGDYSLIVLISTVLSGFFFFGASSSLTRFYYDKEIESSKAFYNGLYLVFIGVVIQILIAFLCSPLLSKLFFRHSNYSFSIQIAIVSGAIGFISNFFLVYIRILKKSVLFLVLNVIITVTNAFVTIMLLKHFKGDITAPFWGILSGNLLVLIIVSLMVEWPVVSNPNVKTLLLLLSFGIPTVFNGLLYYFVEWSDRIILLKYFSSYEVGIYSFGYRLGTMAQLMYITPFSMIWAVVRMQYYNQNDASLGKFTSLISTYYLLIGVIIFFLAYLFSDFLIFIFSGNADYILSKNIIAIIIVSQIIYGYVNIIDFGIYLKRKIHIYIISFLMTLLLNILLNILLLPHFGYTVAAVNKGISYAVGVFIIYYYSNKSFRIVLEWKKIRSILILIVSVIVSSYCMSLYVQGLMKAVINIMIFCLAFFFIYLFILSSSEKGLLLSYIGNSFKEGKTALSVFKAKFFDK